MRLDSNTLYWQATYIIKKHKNLNFTVYETKQSQKIFESSDKKGFVCLPVKYNRNDKLRAGSPRVYRYYLDECGIIR